jgi:hypothetical protein
MTEYFEQTVTALLTLGYIQTISVQVLFVMYNHI